ncbi:hypothetical protein HU200_026172 [Digitaria exilis]|uniref:CBM20 domain-containing protein n=1 Tax=Digitaria exilis TaxID=1010633 RepID=A0A835C1T7_9POAL|nr:hypothetical protein HU200_026172 [Digitaria exilis]CAB3478895.1 unnamed protein product [Digitaria exilis]
MAAVHPPSLKPMEAAAVARRAGLLARARPGAVGRARGWERGVGVCPAQPGARRRLLVASLGVGEPLPAQTLGEEAVALEVREDDDSIVSAENLPPPDADEIAPIPEAKAVRVKFVLKKQCAFGQQFLVVGDDPALGLWDPSKAIALDWSEDHVWTAKTDLPTNKLIEFKFLLRESSGHVRWLHGPNRTLRTTETTNTLVVHEDWDHAKKQKVSEEVEELSIDAEDVFSDNLTRSNGAILADSIITDDNLENKPVTAEVADAHLQLQGQIMVANETKQPQLMLDKDLTVLAEHHGEEKTVAQNGTPSADHHAGSNNDDTNLFQEGALLANRRTSILENDLAWAGKAMQQVLRILGFQIGTTKT